MDQSLSSYPSSLKSITHFLKLAQEHDNRDVVVAYWSRLYALQIGLKIPSQLMGETAYLIPIMDWLENTKKENADNEAITNDVAAQAHLENYALKLFLYADKQDREGNFGKNVVKAFYSSSVIYDVLSIFGEYSEEANHHRKYAKWKAAYIHNCLKNGQTPTPGPMEAGNIEADENADVHKQTSPDDNEDGMWPAFDTDTGNDSNSTPNDIPMKSNEMPTADDILKNPEKLPSPPVEDEKPGGFVPYVPPAQPTQVLYEPSSNADVDLTAQQIMKAQKYCRHAGSALSYDDVKTAISNLQKALTILTSGQDV